MTEIVWQKKTGTAVFLSPGACVLWSLDSALFLAGPDKKCGLRRQKKPSCTLPAPAAFVRAATAPNMTGYPSSAALSLNKDVMPARQSSNPLCTSRLGLYK